MQPFALHLMRHGAPERPGRMLGHADEPASADGLAVALARGTGVGELAAIASSDLTRAAATGRALAEARDLPLSIDPQWRELDFGAWDGLAADAIDAAALGRFWDDPDAHAPPGGERWSDLGQRIGSAIAALSPVPTLVVTHGGAIRAALGLLCGFGQKQLWAFELPYACLLSLRVWPGEPRVAQITGLLA